MAFKRTTPSKLREAKILVCADSTSRLRMWQRGLTASAQSVVKRSRRWLRSQNGPDALAVFDLVVLLGSRFEALEHEVSATREVGYRGLLAVVAEGGSDGAALRCLRAGCDEVLSGGTAVDKGRSLLERAFARRHYELNSRSPSSGEYPLADERSQRGVVVDRAGSVIEPVGQEALATRAGSIPLPKLGENLFDWIAAHSGLDAVSQFRMNAAIRAAANDATGRSALNLHVCSENMEFPSRVRIVSLDGERAWVSFLSLPAKSECGSNGLVNASHSLGGLFEFTVKNAHSPIVFTDSARRITWVNRAFTEITGFALEEVEGLSPGALLQFDETDPQTIDKMRALLDRGAPFRGRVLNRVRSGEKRWVQLDILPVWDDPVTLAGFVAVQTDISELVHAREEVEKALAQVEELRHAIDEHALLVIADEKQRIVDVNTGMLRCSGYKREELLGHEIKRLFPIFGKTRGERAFWRGLSAGKPWRGEVRNRAHTGEVYCIDATVVPYLGDDGRTKKFVILGFDITVKHLVEQHNRILYAAFERSPDAITICGLDGAVRFSNSAAEALDQSLGYEAVSEGFGVEYGVGEAAAGLTREIVAAIGKGEAFTTRLEFEPWKPSGGDGRLRACRKAILDVRATALRNSAGETEAVLVIKREITAECEAERRKEFERQLAMTRSAISEILASEEPLEVRAKRSTAILLRQLRNYLQKRVIVLVEEPGENGFKVLFARGVSDNDADVAQHFAPVLSAGARGLGPSKNIETIPRRELKPYTASGGVGREHTHDCYIVRFRENGRLRGGLVFYPHRMEEAVPEVASYLEWYGEALASAISRERERDVVRRASLKAEWMAKRLQLATDAAGIGIWDFDPRSGRLDWDETMYELFGVDKRVQPNFETWASSVHPEDRARAIEEFGAFLEGKSNFDTRFRIIKDKGSIRHIRAAATLSREEDGTVSNVIGANWDVSDTINALEDMRQTQRVAQLGSWSHEFSSGEIRWSEQLFELFERDSRQGTPTFRELLDWFTPESRSQLDAAVRRATSHGEDYSIVLELQLPGKQTKFIQAEGWVRRDREGKTLGLLGTAMDVTQAVERERALQEITSALDAARDSVLMFDAEELKFFYANQGATDLLGYTLDELRGMTPLDVLPDFDGIRLRAVLAPLYLEPRRPIAIRTEQERKDGGRVPVEISLQLILARAARARFVAIVRDITKQLEFERSLQVAKDQAEQSSRAKSEFLANMSHEIRTPMTAILGYAELLSDPEFLETGNAEKAVRTIQSNAEHLLTVINDVLDMSKIEAGQMSLERILMSPVKVVQEVLSLLQNRAEGKGIQLSLRFATDVPERIRTDPTRLRQILLNLVGNAIKFTEVGGVTVEVACRPDKEEMLFRVQDTGVGMTPEQLAVISRFEPFRQADTRTTRKFGGSGLGLRISNTMANLLGGKIEIDSEYGVGSCFTLSIATGALRDVAFCSANGEDILKCATPVPEETSEQTVQRGAPLDGTRLFLAEDGPDNQRLISYILKRAGAEVSIFDNGKAICDKMSALEPNAWPDLILMDMQMPEMDGYTATRMLLERGVSVPIIALTAHAMSGDRERCLRAGCRDYATKPVDRRLLVDKCAEWIAVGRAETDNRERRAAPPPRSLSH